MTAALSSLSGTVGRFAASRLVQNVGALALVQAMAYLAPLVTLPYLTRVLGPHEWGRVAWMQVIIGYFTILTDWGFSWSGVRKVAALRNDPVAVSECFCAAWAVQWALCAGALAALGALALYAPFFAPFRPYALAGAGVVVAGVLFPAWLLVGLERMREVALVQLVARASAVPLILLFVKAPGDGPRVVAVLALTGLAAGAAALVWMRSRLALNWRWPRRKAMGEEFAESGAIFLARIWIVLYTSLTPTILGAIAGAAAVGQFVLADKLRGAAQSLLAPVSQALFPRMSYLFVHDRPAALRLLRRSGGAIALVAGAASVGLFVLAKPLVLLAGGRDFLAAATLLRWLAPLPLIVAVAQIASIQLLLALGKYRQVNTVLGAAGLFGVLASWVFIAMFQSVGAAAFLLLVETAVCAGMWACALPVLKQEAERN
jgi:PST family polysaccharide transporter